LARCSHILTVKANNKLAILTTEGKVVKYIDVADGAKELLSAPYFWRDDMKRIIYACGGFFVIDEEKGTASPLKKFSLGNGFESSVKADHNRRFALYHDGKEIGQWVFSPFKAKTAPGLIAFAYVQPGENANLGYPDGVAMWDVQSGLWEVSKMSVNQVVGWMK
jgi:hypothetical protein